MTGSDGHIRAELWIPLAYAVLAGAWIATSDEIVLRVAGSLTEAAELSVLKGLAFVAITAILLYAGVRVALDRERAVQRRLAEGEALLRAITDALPDPVSLKDEAGRWLFANPAAVASLDLPLASILGRTDLELQPDRAMARQLIDADRRVRQSGLPEVLEVRRRTTRQEITWLVSKAPWRDGTGRIVGIISTSRDITDRAAREAELAARLRLQEQFAKVAASVPGVICTWQREADGRLTIPYATPAFEAMYGLRATDVAADAGPVMDRIPGDDRDRITATLEESAAVGAPWHGRFAYAHPTRGPRRFEGWAQPVAGSGGAVVWHGYLVDITETEGVVAKLTASEAALAERDLHLRTVLETALDSFRVLDGDGRILDVNDAYCQLTGYAREELLRMHAFDLLPDGHASGLALHERLRAQGALRAELRHRHKDGRILELDMAARFLPVSGGRIVAFLRDITDRKARDQQAWQSQKLESIGQLAGGIAHDFNNLLTVILSCAEVVQADVAAGFLPTSEDVRDIYDAGLRATDLTKQLLTFARRTESAPGSVDLNAVVRGTESMLRRLLGEDVALVLDLQPDLGRTRCDASQLDQVVMNLAVNARDAMPTGGRLVLRTSNVDDPAGPRVCLSVTDTGHGMTPEVRARIFEPFFTTKPHGEGTGLGLATVYGIVKQSDGTVEVESKPGVGTTFRVTFPREGAPAVGIDTADTIAARPGDETVLIVEDDAFVRDVSVRSLRSAGYRVLVATHGEEALAIAQEEPGIKLVITDVVMPGMNGRGLSDALGDVLPGARVLFVSGYTSSAIARRGVSDDGADFLSKPFTPSTLLVRVREVLDRPRP